MADITNSFVPSATTAPIGVSPMSAQPVQPMQNAAPGQMQQMGAATEHFGLEVQDIGERIQNQLDDAMAKQAESKFAQAALQIANGDGTAANPGYLHLKGEAAINGLADAKSALAKAKQAGSDSLATDFQKAMYNRVAQQHLLSFGTQMVDHHFQQTAQFSAQAASDRGDTYIQLAANSGNSRGLVDVNGNPAGDLYNYTQQAIHEKLAAANIALGAGPTSPQGIAIAKDTTSAIAQGVITRMLTDHDYKGAQAYYNSELAAGRINEAAAESLGPRIKANVDQETVEDVVNQYVDVLLRGKVGASGINPQLPIQGGSYATKPSKNDDGSMTFIVPQGVGTKAAATGTVTSMTQEQPGMPYTAEVTHQDGSTTQYGNLSAVNVKQGDQVTQGQQLGLTAKGGLDYSMTDKNGNVVDPTSQVLPAVDRTKFTNPEDAQKIVNQINASDYPPQLKREMIAYAETTQKKNLVLQNENYNINVKQPAVDYFYSHGLSLKGYPGGTAQLRPEDLYTLLQTPAPTQQSSYSTLYWFATHTDYTKQDVLNHMPSLSQSDVISLTKGASDIAANTDQTKTATLDKMQFENSLYQAGLGSLVHMEGLSNTQKQANQQRYVEIRNDLRNIFTDKATSLKRQPTLEEKQQLTDDYLMNNQVLVHDPGFLTRNSNYTDDKLVNYSQLTDAQVQKAYVTVGGERIMLSQIPQQKKDAIVRSLIGQGLTPSWQNIAWVLKQSGK